MGSKHIQQVDFSNPNADKIISSSTVKSVEKNKTAVNWLEEELKLNLKKIILEGDSELIESLFKQAKQMEHQQQVDLLNFSKEMCTPEAPVDYIIKEFEKWKKQQ